MIALALALRLCTAAADGQVYPVAGGPLAHAALKAVASATADVGLRRVGVAKPVAGIASSVGVFAAVKAIELAKGHHLGCRDSLGDLAWHTFGVMTARRHVLGMSLTLGVAVGLGRWASPRWR